MNAEDLYEEIKSFLRYCGVDFHKKDKIKITHSNKGIYMQYENKRIELIIPVHE